MTNIVEVSRMCPVLLIGISYDKAFTVSREWDEEYDTSWKQMKQYMESEAGSFLDEILVVKDNRVITNVIYEMRHSV